MTVIVMSNKPWNMKTYSNIINISDTGEFYIVSDKDNDYEFNKDNHKILITGVE